MDIAKLPSNFDKYSSIIEYFRNNDVDCLSTLVEQFRFFIVYMHVPKCMHWISSKKNL